MIQAFQFRHQDVEFRTAMGLCCAGTGTSDRAGRRRPRFSRLASASTPLDMNRLFKALAASRFAVWVVDRRGDGQSDGERAFESHVDDFGLVVERARGELPGRPCYVIAPSIGGTIALAWTLDHQDDIDGIVLLALALRFRDRTHRVRRSVVASYFRARVEMAGHGTYSGAQEQ